MMSKIIDKNVFEIETMSDLVIIFKIIIWLCSLYMIHDSLLLMCSKNVLKMSRLFLDFPWKQTLPLLPEAYFGPGHLSEMWLFFAEIAHDWKPLNTLYVFPNFQSSSFSFRLLWTIAAEILIKTYGENNSELKCSE